MKAISDIHLGRVQEFQALYDWANENYLELVAKGRMRAIVVTLQRHWQEACHT